MSLQTWYRIAVLALLAGAGAPLARTQAMAGHDMGERRTAVAPQDLPAPERMTGIGNSHLAITANPDAQAWFDQGLNLLHDFWEYESSKAFEQAIRADPNCAMCFWGLYQAQVFRGGSDVYAYDALQSAERLKGHGSERERLYIEAARAERDHHTGKAIKLYRKLVAADPADVQATLFLAGALKDGYTAAHEPKPGTQESISVLEQVLREHPDDSAANHYWIHAMEPSSHPERAIDSAEKLAAEAPASGHMVHMPGHIFYRTGEYAHAEKWFADSTAVDEQYLHTHPAVSVDDDWNYIHNLMYRIANLMEEGKLREAEALSRKLPRARGELAATLYTGSPRDDMARLDPALPLALREGNWKRVQTMAAAAQPGAKLPNLLFLAGELKDFAAGMQALEQGNTALAEQHSKTLDDSLAAMRSKPEAKPHEEKREKHPRGPVTVAVRPDATLPPLVTSLDILSLELRAGVLAAQHKLAESQAAFAKAAKAEADLGYREPPTYIRPVGENEGAALLRSGDADGAHAAYTRALTERPNSGFALYGLARSSEAAHNEGRAVEEYRQFIDAWKAADTDSAELLHARLYLEKHGAVLAAR